MMLSAGSNLGPFEVVGPLGAGGMGEVYRARDMRLDRTVAIKILPAQFSSDPVRKQRFEREAKTISSLNHPGWTRNDLKPLTAGPCSCRTESIFFIWQRISRGS